MVNQSVTQLKEIINWIDGRPAAAREGRSFVKKNPHNGQALFQVAASSAADVDQAVAVAKKAQKEWASMTPVRRGEILGELALRLKQKSGEMAEMAAMETGKSLKAALGETAGAASLGSFYAGEGQRLYGRTTTSGVPNRRVQMIRQPRGIAGLIIAANTPVANIAWKVFPALICGNAAVLKASEDAPGTANFFGSLAAEAGLPAGVLNIVQGLGPEAGKRLVEHPDVNVVSFTGSSAVGKQIAQICASRNGRVSLELGGKNALVICDDADLDQALRWTLLSAFSNAGQRCASASRILIFDSIYEDFRSRLVAAAKQLKAGVRDEDDLGPVINERQMESILSLLKRAEKQGVKLLCGGRRLSTQRHAGGYYIVPTVLEGAQPQDEVSQTEIFGPVAVLYRVRDLQHALELANDSHYGLTSAIHTESLHRAQWFAERVQAGVVTINGGTFGSEPHLPFGGLKDSGNGTREPGTEALDVYSELKNIYLNFNPEKI